MASPFPIRETTADPPDSVRILDVADERDGEILEPLSSETARRVVAAIKDEPQPASEIADAIDSSIQNVQYHLQNLESADLIEPVDTWYSETGNEMAVYAPTHEALVVLTGPGRRSIALDQFLGAMVIVLGHVAIASTAIARLVPTPPMVNLYSTAELDPVPIVYSRPELVFLAGGLFALLVLAGVGIVLVRR